MEGDDLGDKSTAFSAALDRAQSVAAAVIGLDEEHANAAAEVAGMTTRVVGRDGRQLSIRADFRSNRIDLTVESGIVVATRIG